MFNGTLRHIAADANKVAPRQVDFRTTDPPELPGNSPNSEIAQLL
jgi:hypothetical protein